MFYFVSFLKQQPRQSMWRNSWMTSSETTIFRGIWLLQFVWTELQPCCDDNWSAGEIRCTTHHCYALCSAQTCVGNKNLASKTGRSIKSIVECLNYVRISAIHRRIFQELCNKWALNLRYFCTILTFGAYSGKMCWIVFLPCVWN